VGDSSPSPPIVQRLSRNNKLAPSLSERDILSTIDGPDENDRTHISNTLVITVDDDKKMERSMSASPEMRGRDRNNSAPEISPMGHVVRVATVNHDHCNYVSLLVRDRYLCNFSVTELLNLVKSSYTNRDIIFKFENCPGLVKHNLSIVLVKC
jgi:hypothetical protein